MLIMMRQREKYWIIIEHTKMHAYPHEVADALELDYDLVLKITEELKRDMRLEVID